ncbi:hypothetical protein J4Q44_G00090420 [Coregonus suidteri]|uniref:Doublecortin domain-containing protein n=1 Tax=Coregonus suidteri TaxID=861788 RepID=A0AAN8LWK6_9TELE
MEKAKAITVTTPNLILNTRRKPLASTAQRLKAERGASRESEKSNRAEIHSLEFQQFLERCTESLHLPHAAHRLFLTDSREITLLQDLIPDQLVYVSCGEPWVNPHFSDGKVTKQRQLLHLEQDVSQIRHYCTLRHQHDVMCAVESYVSLPSPQIWYWSRDSLSRAHQKIKMCPTFIYPWQGNHEEDEIQNVVENSCSNTDQPAKNRLQQRGRGITQAHRQQFEFSGVKAGSPLQLVRSNPSYSNQRWTLNEGERTLHLLANPELKYKPYSYGAANQKWGWLPELRVLSAFYTSSLDQEVTAANQASVCTTCVSPEPLHQQGFSFTSHNHQLSPTGPFRILKVHKTELSESAADVTLQRLEECLESLRTEAAVLQKQTPSPEVCSAARTQPSVKILAHRNGRGGLEEGQLITTATMPLLLSECTSLLQLTRAAQHLYTADGTQILTLHQLKAWALNDCLQVDTETHIPGPAGSETVFKVGAEDMSSVDEGLMALILRSPIHVWVSCGEPYLPSDGEERSCRGLCGSRRREY